MIKVVTAPNPRPTRVFLAGSIEMGKAEDWQQKVILALAEGSFKNGVELFNPRRNDWDSSWKQSINDPNFFEQVTWELNNLLAADVVFMVLLKDTQSPISLFELGLMVGKGKRVIVTCEHGFWRRGNVEVVCDRFSIPLFEDVSYAIKYLNVLLHW